MEEENIQIEKNNDCSIELEAILFWKGEPQSIKKLAISLEKTEEEIKAGLEILKEKVQNRGVELLWKPASPNQQGGNDEVMLGTSPKVSAIIECLTKEELVRDLGKAGLETISIIAYKGPISRAEIDYIRGVQSNFILRNLQIRGLVEKVTNPKDARSFLYRPTFELLQFLGVSKIEDLPEYEKVLEEFAKNNLEDKAEDIEVEKTADIIKEIDTEGLLDESIDESILADNMTETNGTEN
jgi:segregation and condensation protein B